MSAGKKKNKQTWGETVYIHTFVLRQEYSGNTHEMHWEECLGDRWQNKVFHDMPFYTDRLMCVYSFFVYKICKVF